MMIWCQQGHRSQSNSLCSRLSLTPQDKFLSTVFSPVALSQIPLMAVIRQSVRALSFTCSTARRSLSWGGARHRPSGLDGPHLRHPTACAHTHGHTHTQSGDTHTHSQGRQEEQFTFQTHFSLSLPSSPPPLPESPARCCCSKQEPAYCGLQSLLQT